MIFKYTSVKEVISKVYSDLDIQEESTRVADLVHYAGEAIEKIGAFPILYDKVSGKEGNPLLEVNNYQAKLPYDLHSVKQVGFSPKESGPYYPMVLDTSTIGTDPRYTTNTGLDGYIAPESILTDTTQTLYDKTYQESLEFLNNNPNKKELINSLVTNEAYSPILNLEDAANILEKYRYTIRGGYIKTNIDTGYIILAYKAIPTDKEGYPEIPDLESFKEAVFAYINMKLLYPKWRSGKVRDAVYYDSRQQWNFYRKQAYAEAMMPNTAAERRAMLNINLRLMPEIEESSTFYNSLGNRQYLDLYN